MPTNAAQGTEIDRIWVGLLNGTITPEEARRILPDVRDSSGRGISPDSIESLLRSAAEQRRQGLASGAAWAQPSQAQPVSGPVGTTRTVTGRSNVGPRTELTDPEMAFRRGLGSAGLETGLGSGVFGQFLRDRFQPTQAVFGAQTALGGGGGPNPNAFQEFAQQTQGNVGVQARNAFQELLNQLRGGGLTGEGSGRLQPWLAPETSQQEADVSNLAREAASGKYGPFFAQRFLPSSQRLLEEFQAGPTGQQTTDLLPFLRKAFGL